MKTFRTRCRKFKIKDRNGKTGRYQNKRKIMTAALKEAARG